MEEVPGVPLVAEEAVDSDDTFYAMPSDGCLLTPWTHNGAPAGAPSHRRRSGMPIRCAPRYKRRVLPAFRVVAV